MIKSKRLPCELCGKEVNIRSTLKVGDNKGKKVCPYCVSKNTVKKSTDQNKRAKSKRAAEREGLPEFFDSSISELKENPFCQNCGCKINTNYNPSWNIAHILSKRTYKSVSSNTHNKLFLCSSKDLGGNSCHEKFDSGLEVRKTMPVFDLALQKFVKFKDECLERGKEYTIFEENI